MKISKLTTLAALVLMLLLAACGGTDAPAEAPKAAPAVPAAFDAAQLQGRWVSTTDAKNEIEIKGTEYISYYEGKEVAKDSVEVNNCTGEACTINGNLANSHCITIKEAVGVTCYFIVKCSATDLELSLVGGTGNTNVYKRK